MKILFLHPNMPGQYKHLCRAFADDPKNTVVFITKPRPLDIPNVHKVEYQMKREPSASTHRYLIGTERAVLQGQEVWRMCKKLKDEEGFIPDVICTHPGWGDALYVKDIYPDAPVLSFFEFYYNAVGSDVAFEPEVALKDDDFARVRTKNITNLMSLENADWGVAPTHWQFDQNPDIFKNKISIIHDGIDTTVAKPNAKAELKLPNGKTFKKGDKVVTYIARNFEPYRGFPTFMKAAEMLLKQHKDLHIIAVGADDVSYGKKLGKGQTWRGHMLKQVDLDMDRIHFPGTLPYADLMKLFQVSACHIYLTYPFVLSWSCLESMACEVALVASRTQPLEEVVTDGENGLLADIFSPEEVAEKVTKVLTHKDGMQKMRKAARKTIEKHYALDKLLPLHVSLVKDIAAKKFPPPTHKKIMKLHK